MTNIMKVTQFPMPFFTMILSLDLQLSFFQKCTTKCPKLPIKHEYEFKIFKTTIRPKGSTLGVNLHTLFLGGLFMTCFNFWKNPFYFCILKFHLGNLFFCGKIHLIFIFWVFTLDFYFYFLEKSILFLHFEISPWKLVLIFGKIHFVFKIWNFTLETCFNFWKNPFYFYILRFHLGNLF
jgi:hypothetical protein